MQTVVTNTQSMGYEFLMEGTRNVVTYWPFVFRLKPLLINYASVLTVRTHYQTGQDREKVPVNTVPDKFFLYNLL